MILSAAAHHRLRTPDGWRLSILDYTPAAPPAALVIAGHAMMVDRQTLARPDRPSLTGTLVEAGLRVLVPDLRGHGSSGPTPRDGGSWRYDDLVADVPTYLDLARREAPGLPVVLLGHSLFGHNALAYLGQHPETEVAGVVALAVHLWGKAWTVDPVRRWRQWATFRAVDALAAAWGFVPAGQLGFGTADEALGYWRDLTGWAYRGRWESADGEIDYQANLARVRCPVLHVLSDGDQREGPPDDALRFTAPLPRREVLRVTAGESRGIEGPLPSHMTLVTSPRCAPLWRAMADWIRRRVA